MNSPLDVPEFDESEMEWLTNHLRELEETAIEDEEIHPVNLAMFYEAWLERTKKKIVQTYAETGVPPEMAARALGADISVKEVARDEIPEELAEQLDEEIEAATPDGEAVIDADQLPPELLREVMENIEQDDDPRGFQ